MQTDWKQIYQHRLTSSDFTGAVKTHLRAISDADAEMWPALAAQFAGWLRLRRTYVRVELAAPWQRSSS